MQNDILFKRMLAIEKFSKGLEALGVLECIKRHPEVFECCFLWNKEAVTSRAILEMLEVNENLDETCSQIFDWFQEFIYDLGTEGKHISSFFSQSLINYQFSVEITQIPIQFCTPIQIQNA